MKNIIITFCCFIFFYSCKKDKAFVDTTPLKGQIFLTPNTLARDNGRLWILDENGLLKREVKTSGEAMNFQKWVINGQERYTYLVEEKAGYHIYGFGAYVPGYFVIANNNFEEIKRVYLFSHESIDASDQNMLDAHDFVLLSDDHYLTMAYYEKEVNNIPADLNPAAGVSVIAPVIQEIKDDKVIWQWDGTNYPELYAESVEGNDYSNDSTANDYLHINSLSIDPKDNNLVCSFRNADLILKINRTSGNIMWKLGGMNSSFPLSADKKFLRQHHATFADNDSTLLLFDNGSADERPFSRILEFRLDESAKVIKSFKAFNIPGDFAQYMGSVQKMGDRYFICGGFAKYLMEVNFKTGIKTFELKMQDMTYRAFKY